MFYDIWPKEVFRYDTFSSQLQYSSCTTQKPVMVAPCHREIGKRGYISNSKSNVVVKTKHFQVFQDVTVVWLYWSLVQYFYSTFVWPFYGFSHRWTFLWPLTDTEMWKDYWVHVYFLAVSNIRQSLIKFDMYMLAFLMSVKFQVRGKHYSQMFDFRDVINWLTHDLDV